jgi:hypothetical protein
MKAIIQKRTFILVILSITLGCSTPYRLLQAQPTLQSPVPPTLLPVNAPLQETPSPRIATKTSSATPRTATKTSSATPWPSSTFLPARTEEVLFTDGAEACNYHPAVARLLRQTNADQWITWVRQLSGAEGVTIAGEETRIDTRYSPAMFDGQPNARAFEWLLEQVNSWYPADQIEIQPFSVTFEDKPYTWENLIITLPGQTRPDEIVVLSAHLDSTSDQPFIKAPGAEDNASGSATLIEAARLFRQARFERTLQIVWFTGEEQGLLGSQAFVKDAIANHKQLVGAINLDMFGYDSDNDRCFELHVGTMPQSKIIGQCFENAIRAFNLQLAYDFLTDEAIDRSDHGSFWQADIGAVEVLQNLFGNEQVNGCANADPSPYYHTTADVAANLNLETAFTIARASLAATAGLAQPLP